MCKKLREIDEGRDHVPIWQDCPGRKNARIPGSLWDEQGGQGFCNEMNRRCNQRIFSMQNSEGLYMPVHSCLI